MLKLSKKATRYVAYTVGILLTVVVVYVLWFKEPDYSSAKFTAIIVEPRKHKALDFVLGNFLENLDERWRIIVFHGTENEAFVKDIIAAKQSNRITTANIGRSNLTKEEYSAYMMSTEFLYKVPTETFLIFQTDSMICGDQKNTLERFLKYDYVGAPWKEIPKEYERRGILVGNGGLSLRRKSKMLEILEKCPVSPSNIPEDVFFALPCPAVRIYKPSVSMAKEFSLEMLYSPKTWGIHRAWYKGNAGEARTEEIEAQCTGYKMLLELNRTA
jgi:hypothetical protein